MRRQDCKTHRAAPWLNQEQGWDKDKYGMSLRKKGDHNDPLADGAKRQWDIMTY